MQHIGRPSPRYHALRRQDQHAAGPSFVSCLLLAVVTYLFSTYLIDIYVNGDPRHYMMFYERLRGASFDEIQAIQRSMTGSGEPLYGLLMWASSNLGIEKRILISFINIFLIVPIFILLRRHRIQFLSTILILTNYYILILLVPAERQKIALTCLLLALVIRGKSRVIALAAMPFFHFSSLIFFASIGMGTIHEQLAQMRRNKMKIFGLLLLATCTVSLILFYFQDQFVRKIEGYTRNSQLDLLDIFIIVSIGIYIIKEKWRFIFMITPMVAGVAALGGQSRMNMLSFFVLTYFLISERKTNNPIFIVLLLYFSLRSVFTLQNIINYGNAWPPSTI
jgi:hypothetical protein